MTTPRAALAAALHDVDPRQDLGGAGHNPMCEVRADAILAALASQGYAVTRSEAGLDVERLARAIFAVGDLDEYVNVHGLAKDLAAEYARLAADPEPSDV